MRRCELIIIIIARSTVVVVQFASVSVLGLGVDEFDIELLGHPGFGAGEDGLSDNDGFS